MAYKSWSPAAWTGIAIEKHLIVALKVKANESNLSVVALGRIADESFFLSRIHILVSTIYPSTSSAATRLI